MLRLAVWIAVVSTLSLTGSTGEAASPLGRHLLPMRGMWADFEKPASGSGWFTGDLLRQLAYGDVRESVAEQLDRMRSMGVNSILLEMRTSDDFDGPSGTWPDCKMHSFLGPRWPDPSAVELNGLRTMLDLAQRRGMRVILSLTNTHMDEASRSDSERWLGAILRAAKEKPALDLVVFGGDRRELDNLPPFDGARDSCGGQAEAPLWAGPDSVQARYLQWAISYGMSLGIPVRKLTAEAIVGFYPHEIEQDAGPDLQDRHQWRPLEVLRTIFDRLGIPSAQRTYALSLYAHTKCAFVSFGPCTDADSLGWAEETMRVSRARVGPDARMVLAEWGTQHDEPEILRTVEGLGALMRGLGIEGGIYWKWSDAPAGDPSWAWNPNGLIKIRGPGYRYTAVQREIADLYGFHLPEIPNGSFEDGTKGWKVTGNATAQPLDEPAPWRGTSFLRVTGRVVSTPVRASASTRYTTSARLRGAPATLTIRYVSCRGKAAAPKPATFRFGGATRFSVVPLVYTTPKRSCAVQLEIGAPRGLDVDEVR